MSTDSQDPPRWTCTARVPSAGRPCRHVRAPPLRCGSPRPGTPPCKLVARGLGAPPLRVGSRRPGTPGCPLLAGAPGDPGELPEGAADGRGPSEIRDEPIA